jgi:solute carrier family 31 (copper transporter), member 1
MLAVMTFNIGYFLSILAGTLIGELAVGRFTQTFEDHH